MREIIFRGKRVENGEWVYGMPIWDESHPDPMRMIVANIEKYPHGNNWEVIPETVGQYTGLKDKNGKMIFEGDLLHNPNDREPFYEIIWDKNHAGFSLGDDGSVALRQYCFHEFWKIIGNIHDQKEDV